MVTEWNEAELQRFITDEVEESTALDYKAAEALAKGKKDEITKDVSAMANADGGLIFRFTDSRQQWQAVVLFSHD